MGLLLRQKYSVCRIRTPGFLVFIFMRRGIAGVKAFRIRERISILVVRTTRDTPGICHRYYLIMEKLI